MDEAVVRADPEPWNKGKLVGQKAPLKLKEIWAIRIRLQLYHRARDLALFVTAFFGVSFVVLLVEPIWIIYRVVKGWLYLNDNKPMYN